MQEIREKLKLADEFVDDLNERYISANSTVKFIEDTIDDLERRIEEINGEVSDDEKVHALLGEVSKEKKEAVANSLSQIATYALQKIKGEDFDVVIKIDTETKTKAKIVVRTKYLGENGDVEYIENDPYEDRGGGIADMVATSIFFASNEILDSNVDYIFADEPGKNVSEEYAMLFANFIRNLGERFGKQVILSTHNKRIGDSLGDNVIEIYQEDEISKARVLDRLLEGDGGNEPN